MSIDCPTIPLKDAHRAGYADNARAQKWDGFCFVAVTPNPDDTVPGQQGALGFVRANERGYFPVPAGWACYPTLDAAQADADQHNNALGLSDEQVARIQASSMGGRYYREEAA